MHATRQTRQARRLPVRHAVISSVLTGLMLGLAGAGRALAGPAPVDSPRADTGTRPSAGGLDSGPDWTGWLLVGAGLLMLVALVSVVASSTRLHRPAPV